MSEWDIIETDRITKHDFLKLMKSIENIEAKIDKLSKEKNLALLIKIEKIEKELILLKEKIEPNSNVRTINTAWRSQFGSLAPSIISLPNLSTNYLNNISRNYLNN